MDISFHTNKTNLDTTRGYGNAGFQVIRALQELGHYVPFDSPAAAVQMSFSMPTDYKFNPNQYRIGYTPWESTELPSTWIAEMNKCDEVWATSNWVADVFEDNNVKPPIKVYEHGLDERWAPVKRNVLDVVHFLHVGEPAPRKGGQMTVDAFRAAFGNRTDVHLTVKAYAGHFLRTWEPLKFKVLNNQYNNVTVVDDNIGFSKLLEMYRQAHCLIYPSYGEGFGFIPLQALGTGMPVISTGEWAPYRHHLTWEIPGRMDRSVWSVHPGNILYPDYDDLVSILRTVPGEIEDALKFTYAEAPAIHAEYNWKNKTEKAFAETVNRLTEK